MSETGRNDSVRDLREAVSSIQAGDFGHAIEILEVGIEEDASGERHALLGLACFHLEDYPRAEEHYTAALECSAGRDEWKRMRDRAHANALAEVQVAVPPVEYFDASTLLKAPRVKDGALPGPPLPIHIKKLRKLLETIGNVLGVGLGFLSHAVVRVHGRISGYRGRIWTRWWGSVWTSWYRRGQRRAVLTLAYMRDRLNRKCLYDTYPRGKLVAFQEEDQIRPEGVRHFRTADGSWNNLDDPKEGAALTRFMRNVENEAIGHELEKEVLTPNPREVSRKLLTRENDTTTVPFLNLLAASWIQFQNHDWVSHGENLEDLIEIPLAEDDPIRRRYHQKKMCVGRTQPDPTRRGQGESTPVTSINEVTHWWDGSQIYGSDQETQDRLRSHVDGRLELGERELLPVGENGVEDTGFTRNWWVGLSMLHTLFVREHNAICERLKRSHPHWDDDRLFGVARLVNAAVMAKIHTVEWTPAILPNPAANQALHANWFGLLTYWLHSRKQRRTRSAVNVRHPELGGVVGNPIEKHGSRYGLTEEFVEVYRLHSLLPELLTLRRHDSDEIIKEIPLPETRQAGSPKLSGYVSMADLFYSFGNQHPGSLVLNNFPRFLQELSIPGHPVIDLGAVDILRARERGVPRYNEFRRQLQLNPIRRFEDLGCAESQVEALKEVYGSGPEGVEKLDLLIGTLAEGVRPHGFGFGETLFQIFILNATRRLQADRFYTELYDEETYTKEGLDWVDAADLKTVLLRHHPELAVTGLANVRNAFEPWDTKEKLEQGRHPLRAYAEDLQPDPWTGDRYRGRRDVLDYRRDARSGLFRSKLVMHYFNRGVFLRKPKDKRVGGQIQGLLRRISGAPVIGGWCRRKADEVAQVQVDRSDLEALSAMRQGAGAIWFTLGKSETLALFDRSAIAQVLAESPRKFGPSDAKRRGMAVFQPNALTITSDPDVFETRRAIAETVLGFGARVHELAPDFLEVVRREVDAANRRAPAASLAWKDVDSLCKRIALVVALGKWNPRIFETLEELMGEANIVAATDSAALRMLLRLLLARRDTEGKRRRGRFGATWLDTGKAFLDRASTRSEFREFYAALKDILDSPSRAKNSLVGRLAEQPDDVASARVYQIPHWIFALRGTLAVHTIYTLALLAADQEAQEQVRDRLGTLGARGIDEALAGETREPSPNFELLERCILEAGRLWPAVPLLVRGVQEDGVVLKVGTTPLELRKGQQVLIHNVAINRDEEQVGESPHAFRPERWERRGMSGNQLKPVIAGERDAATLFSDGVQTCPGRDLALLLVKGIVGRLLLEHRYQLEPGALDTTNLPVSYDQFEIVLQRQRIR